jgi:hypothetical protein
MIEQNRIKAAAEEVAAVKIRPPHPAAVAGGGVLGGLAGAGVGGVAGAGLGALGGGLRGLITGGLGAIPYHLGRRMGYFRDKGEKDKDISAWDDLKKALLWGGGLGAGAGSLVGGLGGAAGGGALGAGAGGGLGALLSGGIEEINVPASLPKG